MEPSQIASTLERAVAGDRKACEAIFKAHAPKLYRVAQRYVGTAYDAQDVVHDAFVKAFRKLDTFDSTKGELSAWLRRIVTNEALSWLRREKLRFTEAVDEQGAFAKTSPNADQQLEFKDLLSALDTLPSGARTVFNLAVFEGYAHTEIGEMLGITDSASRAQLTRARKHLKSFLAPLLPDA